MPKKRTGKPAVKEKRFVLMLATTRKCNIACKYCYEPHTKNSSEAIDFELAKKMITRYMQGDDKYKNVEIQFFGGEPLLAFSLIKRVVEWFHTKTWSKGHVFFITTNGTILTREMKDWLYRHRKCVVAGISLDGNKTAHDIGRDNSYDRVLENLPFFQKTWPFQPVKMTVCGETIPYLADSVIQMEKMGLDFTTNMVFDDVWGNDANKKQLLLAYKKQLERLVDYYYKHPELEPVSPILDRKTEHISSERPVGAADNDCVRFCGAGHEMAMVDTDGKVYPCHRFSSWITGRPSPPVPRQNRQQNWQPESCNSCKLISMCPTCAGFNWETNGDTAYRTTFHCEAFKLEVLASAKLQAMRLGDLIASKTKKITMEEARIAKARIKAILELTKEGL